MTQTKSKICRACHQALPLDAFGTVKGVPNSAKICRSCNSRRAMATYNKRHNRVHIEAKLLPLREHNRNVFLHNQIFNEAFLVVDTYSGLEHWVRVDTHFPLSFRVDIDEEYITCIERKDPYKDKLVLADILSSKGLKVVTTTG